MANKAFPGSKLFELKATHGLPLDVAVDRIVNTERMVIDWQGFIDQARAQGWYDFQTLDVAEQALTDADVPRDYRDAVVLRMKAYVMEKRHAT
jgi:Alanyl-tRNA synthetase